MSTTGYRIEIKDDIYGWVTPGELEGAAPAPST
jgi:hypothetical protein